MQHLVAAQAADNRWLRPVIDDWAMFALSLWHQIATTRA
jgi:hypothetical protein